MSACCQVEGPWKWFVNERGYFKAYFQDIFYFTKSIVSD